MNAPESSFVRLAAVNVSGHIEKKNGLSYLSWAWAYDYLMRLDPEAEITYGEPKMFGETMMVYCTVKAFGKSRTAHLPVMDYKNKSIANPDAFQVNTAMQRCMVKAIALHGLGLYIYAGEDLPGEGDSPRVAEKIEADKGKVMPTSGAVERLEHARREFCDRVVSTIIDCINAEQPEEAWKAYKEVTDTDEKVAVWSLLPKEIRKVIKTEGEKQGAK